MARTLCVEQRPPSSIRHGQSPRGPNPARAFQDREHGPISRRRCRRRPDAGRRHRDRSVPPVCRESVQHGL